MFEAFLKSVWPNGNPTAVDIVVMDSQWRPSKGQLLDGGPGWLRFQRIDGMELWLNEDHVAAVALYTPK